MNARELHDEWPRLSSHDRALLDEQSCLVILRALALQAAVDESDGLVRMLLHAARNLDGFNQPISADFVRAAAARIVALEQELASVKAERDALKMGMKAASRSYIDCKAHAEAMAKGIESDVYYADAPGACDVLEAYRRDFPKDAP